MSEILVVSDADLEEGEIVDDVEVETVEIKPILRPKKLPRRYVLHEKNEKIRRSSHHRQSSHHKKHKCSHHLERSKLGSKQLNSGKSSSSHSKQRESPITSLTLQKSAFKNYSSPRREPNRLKKLSSEHKPLKDPLLQIPLPGANSDELKLNKALKLIDISKESSSQVTDILNTDSRETLKQDERYIENNINEEEDEEDEEELRRIALATCLKVPVNNHVQNSEQLTGSIPAVNYVPNDKRASSKASNTLQSNCDIFLPGNHEVVDMELDSDCSTEEVKSDDLFVIDRNPLNSSLHKGLPEHKLNQHHAEPHQKINEPTQEFCLDDSQNISADEIEEARLRAEVIASMLSAKPRVKEFPVKPLPPLSVKNPNKILTPARNNLPIVQNRKVVRSHPLSYKHPSTNFLNITRLRVVNKAKLNYLKSLTPKKSPLIPQIPQRKINAGPGRLVITLSNDSSSEESDEENDQKKEIVENASLASIEALISDARQRSDCLKSNDTNSVSCLSKAQQEEYNNLKKILAEKLSKQTAIEIERKKSLQLKILTKKVSVAESNLKKEINMLTGVEKELLEKKQEYITSKLKVQLLKEQLHAAELIRAANLDSWKKTSAKLDIQKKSVIRHKAIVDLLEKKLKDKQLPQEHMVLSSNNILHLPS